ncbi:tRNA-dependent cyclodipeptide synthase [Streptomyces boluensis]|uniref:Cyclodipeptide synthase n=1 Tax=Streptomyces boluensis TaxID=1775135 RepID=A0A964XNX4_9ACTN|nr:tRNA-dependent cyclodipeptide synthase [Streptomyces boluensis]NBE56124.1 tRNA-dependent cyclodipeptide synthase [Streptomyces boluensis]
MALAPHTSDLPEFTAVPLTPNCKRVLDLADHLLIGVSPGNSYFSIPNLARLMRWGHAAFRRVDVVCPDNGLVFTYRALGHSEEAAARKARKEVSGVRRRIRRAWERSGVPVDGQRTHLLSDLANSAAYQKLRARAEKALVEDEQLHHVCFGMTRRALRAAAGDVGEDAADGLDTALAMEYLIAELPFFVDTPSILNVPSSIVSYHAPVEFADLIYTGRSVLRAAGNQGHVLLNEGNPLR